MNGHIFVQVEKPSGEKIFFDRENMILNTGITQMVARLADLTDDPQNYTFYTIFGDSAVLPVKTQTGIQGNPIASNQFAVITINHSAIPLPVVGTSPIYLSQLFVPPVDRDFEFDLATIVFSFKAQTWNGGSVVVKEAVLKYEHFSTVPSVTISRVLFPTLNLNNGDNMAFVWCFNFGNSVVKSYVT